MLVEHRPIINIQLKTAIKSRISNFYNKESDLNDFTQEKREIKIYLNLIWRIYEKPSKKA